MDQDGLVLFAQAMGSFGELGKPLGFWGNLAEKVLLLEGFIT